jgi:hypothetical protein
MVQNILDSHSHIYGGPEFDRIPNIIDLRNKLQTSLKEGRITEYTTNTEIDEAIKKLVTTLLKPQQQNPSITHISEKTPWNVLFFEELLELFPEAKFIIVLRNPLDVFNSMKKVGNNAISKGVVAPDFTVNYKIAAAYMEAVYKIGERLLKTHPNQIYVVRYEHLLSNLESETKRLFAFLELNWEHEVLNFYNLKHPGEDAMIKNEIWYTKKQFNENPKDKEVTATKSLLTYQEKVFIKYLFRKNLFLNANHCYFNEPNLFQKIIGKLILNSFQKKYRFKNIPKRILG